MFSSKNSKEYKMEEPGGIWGYSSDTSVFLVHSSLFTYAWFADLKKEITLNPLCSKTRYSFSASLPKKVQYMLWRCFSTARALFSKLVQCNVLQYIKGLIWRKKMYLTNFYFFRTLFLTDSYKILQNDAILINHESFFQEKESLQLYRSRLLEINSFMAETIKNQFS